MRHHSISNIQMREQYEKKKKKQCMLKTYTQTNKLKHNKHTNKKV